DYYGTDSFTYAVSDGEDESNTATVTININPVNDAPVAVDDAYSGYEDMAITETTLTLNDYDVDMDSLEVHVMSYPANGLLDCNPVTHVFTYTPSHDWFGTDSFTYRLFDGQTYSNPATVVLTIVGVNDAPYANDDFYTADEGLTLIVDSLNGLLANDVDVDGDSLTAELVDWPTFGLLTLNPDGSFEYFVDGWSGPVIFTYTTFDGTVYSNPATVIIDVIGDDDETGPEITITYAGDSTDGNPGFWTVTVDDPESGVDTITVEIDGVIVGSAAGIYAVPNSLGTHTITVTATNADLDTGPSDQETSVLSNTVNIIDDDVTGPSIFITYTGDMTDINPGTWTVSVSDSISGVHSLTVEIDGTVVGTLEGDYAVPGIEGDHTITVTAHNNDLDRLSDQETSILSDTITIESTLPPESLLEITGETTGSYSDPVYLEVRLMDATTGLPISDKLIVLTLGMVSVDIITDSSGIASYILVLDQQPGDYMLLASFTGDDDYLGSSAMCEFVIAKEYATVEYTGRTVIPTSDDTITLMATVFEEDDSYWGDLARIYVTFTLYLSSELIHSTGPIMVTPTDVQGVGLATVEIPNLDAGEYLVVVSFKPLDNDYYFGPEDDASISIYEPERESIQGAGWIKDADGNKVFFVFHVSYSCKGSLKGFFFLTYRVNAWVYFIRSTEILSLSADGNFGSFEVEVKISQYNLDTHQWICSDERYRLRVDVWDKKKSHEDDAIQLRVYDKNGLVKYELGFDPYGDLIRGNIKIKEPKKRHRW
ncbi:MAG: tandem-95 repeat protein, partial [Candidatus Thorarchaeota archaeon]